MIKILRISAVIALFTLLWFALPVLAHKQGVWDFSGFWGAAKLFMQGKNPYDLEAKIQFLSSQGVLATNLRPLNPPPFVFLFIPFSYVDFDTAKNLWILLSLVTYLLAVGITLKQITSCDGTSSKRNIRVEELGLVLLLLPLPILYHLSVGQVTVFCCLCSVLSISEKSSGESSFNLFLRGVALSFTCIKPHLFIPLYIFFTLSWCHAKNLWPLIGLLTGIAIVILCSYFPHDGAMWKHYFSSLGESPLYTGTPSLGAVLQRFDPERGIFLRLLPLFIVTSFIVVKATSIRSFQSKCLILASGTLAAPYLWLYDFILLMPYLICVFHEDITKVKYQDPLSLLLLIGLISVNFIGLLARDAIVDAIIPITALLICFLRLRLKNYRSSS